ncbi:MAG: hypothetical protein ORN26_00295 [Candidatus Pacebacteria bacterium]|nr:hypothetical protein [Candidatus Paceibacterota bacterium]
MESWVGVLGEASLNNFAFVIENVVPIGPEAVVLNENLFIFILLEPVAEIVN